MPTQSFAGPCFLAKKEAFLQAHLEEECWMDGFPYPLGEDQMLAHKMYLGGSSLLIHYGSGIQHRDAKSAHPDQSRERFYNNSILRYAVWYRSIYQTSQSRIEEEPPNHRRDYHDYRE